MTIRHRDRPARVRCTGCGSTRVRGITLGYLEGPLGVDEDGLAFVAEGEWIAHDEHDIEPCSVICSNCGGARFRVEGARREAVMVASNQAGASDG